MGDIVQPCGFCPAQRRPANHVRRGTEQHLVGFAVCRSQQAARLHNIRPVLFLLLRPRLRGIGWMPEVSAPAGGISRDVQSSTSSGESNFLRKSFEPDEVEVIPCAGEKAERHVSAEDVSAGARLCLRHGTPPIVPYRAAVFNPGMADRGLPICAGRDRCCAQTADGAGLRQPYKI